MRRSMGLVTGCFTAYVSHAHTGLTMSVTSVLAQPHVPFVFPAEFLAYFPEDLADIPLADDTYAPTGMPDAAWHFPAVRGTPRYKQHFLLGMKSSAPNFLDGVLTLWLTVDCAGCTRLPYQVQWNLQ